MEFRGIGPGTPEARTKMRASLDRVRRALDEARDVIEYSGWIRLRPALDTLVASLPTLDSTQAKTASLDASPELRVRRLGELPSAGGAAHHIEDPINLVAVWNQMVAEFREALDRLAKAPPS